MAAGIREKKKVQTQKAIIDAAYELFTEKGYDETKIEDIADRAVVGVGTVYNYFGSKQGLLMQLSHIATKKIIAKIQKIIENPGDDPEAALLNAMWTTAQYMFQYDKKLMRKLMIVAITEPDDLGRDLMEDDMKIMYQMGILIEHYQKGGKLSAELPIEQSVMVMYSSLMMIFHIYLATSATKTQLKKTLRDYIHIIFIGWNTPGGEAT